MLQLGFWMAALGSLDDFFCDLIMAFHEYLKTAHSSISPLNCMGTYIYCFGSYQLIWSSLSDL